VAQRRFVNILLRPDLPSLESCTKRNGILVQNPGEGHQMARRVGRRQFMSALGGAAVGWPLAARAQRPATTRVGVVTIQPRGAPIFATFAQRLRELGYVEDQNLVLDFLSPEQQPGGNVGVVEEFLRRKVDVILAPYESTLKAVLAVKATVPVVMMAVDYDPLAHGYVESLARPGGNVTGLYLQQLDLARKRVELLTQALPNVKAATVFWDSISVDQWNATRGAAAAAGLRVADVEFRDQPYNYEAALARVPAEHRNVVIFCVSPVFYRDRQRLADFTLRNKIVTVFALREWVDAGGVLSYGPNFPAMYKRAAEFVDAIVKGAKVSGLPIEQPTKFELILNTKVADAIGITISPAILVRADEVIE
jgi:putative tryptophan/tyrosine transport system substrate-binding protein